MRKYRQLKNEYHDTGSINNALLELKAWLLYDALSLVSDQDKAHERLQETFMKALTYRDHFT